MGTLIGIYIADAAGAAMRRIEEAELVPGRGIVGDRYFTGLGTFSPGVQQPSHEVTLVEIEQVDQFNAANDTPVTAGELRRNLVTRDVELNDLVGVEFTVGNVVLKGIRLCEPCDYLAARTLRGVLPGLTHRAGLRAGIIAGGTARIGDSVKVPGEDQKAR